MQSATMEKTADTIKELMALRNAENQAEIDSQIIFQIWEGYNQEKVNAINSILSRPLNNQTKLFFAAIPTLLKNDFHLTPHTIIQFGIATGQYFINSFMEMSKIIGYDFSPTAINHISSTGMQGRLINLNKIDETNHLAYQNSLETDLSCAAEILIIRTLECLTPQAADLLIHTLINLCKPDSRIYIETWQQHNKTVMTLETGRNIPSGYIPSFFAARTDFEFKLHRITQDERADRGEPGEHSTVERLVVRKR